MSYKIVVQNGDGCAPPLDHYSPATAQAAALSARSGRRCSIHGAKLALQYFPCGVFRYLGYKLLAFWALVSADLFEAASVQTLCLDRLPVCGIQDRDNTGT